MTIVRNNEVLLLKGDYILLLRDEILTVVDEGREEFKEMLKVFNK